MQAAYTYNLTPSHNSQSVLLKLIKESERFLHQFPSISPDLPYSIPSLAYSSTTFSGSFQPEAVWSFIDMQNLHKGTIEEGWRIDWYLFRKFLWKQFGVTRAIVFMGFVMKHQWLYKILFKAGFDIQFREVEELPDGKIEGGNVDADLSAYVMDHKQDYQKAIVVADDGDYAQTLKRLKEQGKLQFLLSSHSVERTSKFIKKAIGVDSIQSVQTIRSLIERKKHP